VAKVTKRFIKIGISTDELNARDLPANFTPTIYTPAQVSSEGADKISAHLKGIDTILANSGAASITSLSGDVTATGPGGAIATISSGAVTLVKMAPMDEHTYIGRFSSGTGIPEAVTTTQLTADLNLATTSLQGMMSSTDKTKLDELTAERSMANAPLFRDYSISSLSGGVWNQLVASTTSKATKIHVFDSSGTPWYLGYGAISSEVAQIIIPPGGDVIEILIPQDTRLSAQTVDATSVNAGTLLISFLT
jgi:hypothetical protein